MGRSIDFETRDQAHDLFLQGATLEQVAAETGVSLTQLKAWSAAEGWTEHRDEYRQSLREIKLNTIRLRRGLIEKALATLDPQIVYAAATIERVAISAEKAVPARQGDALDTAPVPPAREIKTPAEAVAALQEALEARLAAMLSRPGEISLASLRDIQKTFALIDEMKERYMPDGKPAAGKGLSDEAAEEIRRKILGIKG